MTGVETTIRWWALGSAKSGSKLALILARYRRVSVCLPSIRHRCSEVTTPSKLAPHSTTPLHSQNQPRRPSPVDDRAQPVEAAASTAINELRVSRVAQELLPLPRTRTRLETISLKDLKTRPMASRGCHSKHSGTRTCTSCCELQSPPGNVHWLRSSDVYPDRRPDGVHGVHGVPASSAR
jgi:hypothetical protein